MPDLSNKVVLVTGGSYGIGQATAIMFAAKGANVVIADILENKGTLEGIKNAGGDVLFVKCDISKEADIKSLFEKINTTYGQLDFAFNNAGTEGIIGPMHECSMEDWTHTIGVNLTGLWLCMKYELQMMLTKRKGCIVNNSSIAGLRGFEGSAAYVASKHGVMGLTKTAALETAKWGVRVNAVCPGVIHTPMIDRITGREKQFEKQFEDMEPLGRMGRSSEVAEAVMWLCSDAASFISGISLPVDGGYTAR